MKAKDVGELLHEMGLFTNRGGVLGFELPPIGNGLRYRVESGGGIAGDNDKWTIVSITSGKAVGSGSPLGPMKPCATAKQLKRALEVWRICK